MSRRPVKWVPLAALAATLSVLTVAEAAETLRVTLNKVEVMRIARAAAVVVVGNPEIAEVSVESPRLIIVTGRGVGETSLTILDSRDNEVAAFDIVVVPEAARHVTVNRSTTTTSTLSCDPRCAKTQGPDAEEGGRGAAGGGSAGGGGSGGGGAADQAGVAAATSNERLKKDSSIR